jgi:hypothetical protein
MPVPMPWVGHEEHADAGPEACRRDAVTREGKHVDEFPPARAQVAFANAMRPMRGCSRTCVHPSAISRRADRRSAERAPGSILVMNTAPSARSEPVSSVTRT